MLRDYPGDKKKFVRKICKSTGWPERLSYIYSVSIFLIITTLLSWRANFDKPLRCMMTAENPGRWVDYYDDLCYINGTYRLDEKDTFVHSRNQTLEKAEPINYYQWAHYILLLQTLLWYVPHAFWRFTRSCTAFHLMSILAYGIKNEKKPSYIPWAQHVQEHLKFAYKVQKRPSVVYFYLITKWLYVGIAFLQLSIITYFIGEGDYFWGLKKFMMATSGGRFTWHQLEEFPFVSYCDSIKFELGQWKPSSLECVMPMNMFLDKAYVFFWFWIVFVLVVQFFTALHATILYMIPTWTHRELCSILQLGERDPKRRVVHIFLKEHLHLEGFLLLRILKENWSDLIAYEMGKQLWTISEGI